MPMAEGAVTTQPTSNAGMFVPNGQVDEVGLHTGVISSEEHIQNGLPRSNIVHPMTVTDHEEHVRNKSVHSFTNHSPYVSSSDCNLFCCFCIPPNNSGNNSGCCKCNDNGCCGCHKECCHDDKCCCCPQDNNCCIYIWDTVWCCCCIDDGCCCHDGDGCCYSDGECCCYSDGECCCYNQGECCCFHNGECCCFHEGVCCCCVEGFLDRSCCECNGGCESSGCCLSGCDCSGCDFGGCDCSGLSL